MDKTGQMSKFHEQRTRLRELYKQIFIGGKANKVNNNFKKFGMYSKNQTWEFMVQRKEQR